MHLYPLSGRFHCHGCGDDGDKIDFVSSIYSWLSLEDIFHFGGLTSLSRRIAQGHPELNFGAN